MLGLSGCTRNGAWTFRADALERQIVDLVRELPAAGEFALAGGAAPIVPGLVVRETHDLDSSPPEAKQPTGWHQCSSGAW